MKAAMLILALALAACSDGLVTQVHIDAATSLCAANGGIKSISHADTSREYEGCGYRCTRATGRVLSSADVACRNGATFKLMEAR